jgi:hypothetical protein
MYVVGTELGAIDATHGYGAHEAERIAVTVGEARRGVLCRGGHIASSQRREGARRSRGESTRVREAANGAGVAW